LVFEVGDPVGAGEVGVVNEEAKIDGVGAGLGGVVDFETATFYHRWGQFFDGLLDDAVEDAGGYFGSGLGGDIVDGFDGAFHVVAAFGGDEEDGGEGEEGERFAQSGEVAGLGYFLVGFFGEVPFVDEQEATAFGFDDFSGDLFVAGGGAGFGIEHEDDDVGAFDAFFGAKIAEPVDGAAAAGLFLDAGGVDELIVAGGGAGADGEGDFDAVSGGAGDVGDDDAVVAEEAVDVGGFSGIGAADDGDAEGGLGGGVGLIGKLLNDGFEEGANAAVLNGGDGVGGKAEGVEVDDVFVALGVVGFIGEEEDGAAAAVE